MKTIVSKRFARQLRKCPIEVQHEAAAAYKEVVNADSATEITRIKKLKGFSGFYRIRINDFRIGVEIESGTAQFVCIMHRKTSTNIFLSSSLPVVNKKGPEFLNLLIFVCSMQSAGFLLLLYSGICIQ